MGGRQIYRDRFTEWYLVCTGSKKDYVVASQGKPYIENGFYVISGKSYITPEPLLTCSMIEKVHFDEAMQNKAEPDA
jgi:hypothetical protein